MPLPKHIELQVRGNRQEVEQALVKHGFHPNQNIFRIQEITKDNCCRVFVPSDSEERVEQWFKEFTPVNKPGCLVCYLG